MVIAMVPCGVPSSCVAVFAVIPGDILEGDRVGDDGLYG